MSLLMRYTTSALNRIQEALCQVEALNKYYACTQEMFSILATQVQQEASSIHAACLQAQEDHAILEVTHKAVENPLVRMNMPANAIQVTLLDNSNGEEMRNASHNTEPTVSEHPMETSPDEITDDGDIPVKVKEAIACSHTAVGNITQLDMLQLRSDFIMYMRLQLESDTNSVSTIYSSHQSLNNEAEHWVNASHKVVLCTQCALEINFISAAKQLQDFQNENAPRDVIKAAECAACYMQSRLNHNTRLAEASLLPTAGLPACTYGHSPAVVHFPEGMMNEQGAASLAQDLTQLRLETMREGPRWSPQ